ncbi:MAG: hypothetical protein AAF340_08620 [Pseudomonadota bacterium]
MRFFSLCAAAALLVFPQTSAADDLIAAYFVELGPQDFYNSRGTRLGNVGGIFQQDRANVHRFGMRHGGDSLDPVFTSPEMRAQIPTLLARGNANAWADIAQMDPATAARPGYADYRVSICGRGGAVTYMFIDYADGDGYGSC